MIAAASLAVWLALPAVDGLAGVEVGGEAAVAPEVGAVVAASVRKSATGDYDGWITGLAGEVRWYWRGPGRWSHAPAGSLDGWFTGARVDLARSTVALDDRPIGTTVIGGLAGELGYRFTPWRALTVTGLVALGHRWERDTDGRLPTHDRGTLGFGLELGWIF